MVTVLEFAASMKALAIFLFWLLCASFLMLVLVNMVRNAYREWMQ